MKQRKCIGWLHCNTAFKNVGSAKSSCDMKLR